LSLAPHVILNEIGQPFETVLVSLKQGANRSEEFRRLNPKAKIPVLDTGTQIITEAAAILCYLGLSHPEMRLIPASPLEFARAIEWTNWLGVVLAAAIEPSVHPERFTDDFHGHGKIRAKGREHTVAAYAQIEEKLLAGDWALSEGYSVVDPMLMTFFKWGCLLKLPMQSFVRWTAHTRRMEARAAVRLTLAAEGISVWA
jgi:glutathione S-transferase